TLRVEWKPGPSIASAQTSPDSANQLSSRCNPIASTVITTSASPIERHRMERIGGDSICESALTAASNISIQPLVKTLARGRYRRRLRQEGRRGSGALGRDRNGG